MSALKTKRRPVRMKRSYSLTRESVAFLCELQKQRQFASQSETLDRLLLQMQQAQKIAELNGAYTAYYASAPQEHLDEDAAWSELAGNTWSGLAK